MRKIIGWVLLICWFCYGIGSATPDRDFVLQQGKPWQATGCIVDSGISGPTALVLGGVHGNEPAGALAAERLCKLVPTRGKWLVIARVNPLGLEKGVRYLPEIGDMNRVYPPTGEGSPAEQLGTEIIGLMKTHAISLLIDLHEARTFHRLDRSSLGQTLLFADNDISTELAMTVLETVNHQIADPLRKFSLVGHPIPTSAAWYAGKHLGIAAFTVETSSQQNLQERVEQQFLVARSLLAAGGWLQR